MSAVTIQNKYKELESSLGRGPLHALYPKDIPAYFCALELVNSEGITVDYFAWPILPDEIRETDTPITTVRKTMSAVNVQKNSSFNPKQISLKGDFGRKFKLLFNGQDIIFAGFGVSTANGIFKISPPNFLENPITQFSNVVKNGYGCLKLLEAMKDKSKGSESNGKPYSLYFYNPILGNNYQVEFVSFSHFQDKDRYNMISAYQMQLVAIASLDTVLSRTNNLKSAIKNLTINSLQRTANSVGSGIRTLFKK